MLEYSWGKQSWLRHNPCKMQRQTGWRRASNPNRQWVRESAYGMRQPTSMVAPVLVKPGGKRQLRGGVFLTFSASQPRCRISRLPAMPVFPSCSLTSAITRASRSLTLEWMAVNQAWAVAESLLLKITVCLASGEWISSCLEKQREGLEGFLADHASSSPESQRWTHSLLLLVDCQVLQG